MEKIRNNYIELSGNLGKNPELRVTKTGKEVLSFTIAVNDYKKVNNEFEVTATHWLPIVMWEPIPDAIKGLTRGDRVGINGRVATRSWEGKNGKVYVTEIIAKEVTLTRKVNGKPASLNPSKMPPELAPSSFTEEELPF